MDFKSWIFNEATFDPSKIKRQVFKQNNKTWLSNHFNLKLDSEDNVVEVDFDKDEDEPYMTISPGAKNVSLQKMSPQSSDFHKIIEALKSKYNDIESWNVDHFFMAGHMQASGLRKRTVGYWLSRPEINLAERMPKYLYHGTSSNLWYEGIKNKGLMPRGATGSTGSYGSQNISALSQENLVYLSTDPDFATREAADQSARKHGGMPLILRIRVKGLDPKRFLPDEDTRAYTAQRSIDISSTLAYNGEIPPDYIEPFLLGTRQTKNGRIFINWEKFRDIEEAENPLTTELKQGKVPSSSDSRYYALKDAGLIKRKKVYSSSGHSNEYDVVVNPEEITNSQIKDILRNSGWTQNVKMILQDLSDGYRGGLYQIKDKPVSREILEHPIMKMLIDSDFVTLDYHNNQAYLRLNSWSPENNAIALAKMLGNKNFISFLRELKDLLDS